jgi:pimeloyl-ACP methyl ester carboxylesterase
MNRKLKILGWLSFSLWAAFGRYPVSWLLSSRRKSQGPGKIRPLDHAYIISPTGNTLYVEIDGPEDARSLVFLHGLNSSLLQWYYQRLFFRKRHRLILIDLPGHGRSPKPNDTSIKALAADLQTILLHLSARDPVLYGHSIGAMVIMEYCLHPYSPKPRGIILQQGSYTNPLKTMKYPLLMQMLQRPIAEPWLRFIKKHPIVFSIIGRLNYLNGINLLFYRYILFTGQQSPAQLRYMAAVAAKVPPEVVADGILATLRFDASDKLDKIASPALIIGGLDDRIVQPSAALYLAGKIKDARLAIVKGGHQSMVEYFEENNKVLSEFLAELR